MTDVRQRETETVARRRPTLVLVVDNAHLPPRRPRTAGPGPEAVLLFGISVAAVYAVGLLVAAAL